MEGSCDPSRNRAHEQMGTIGLKTGGRQKGVPNKNTIAKSQATAETAAIIEEAIPGAFEGNAHALLAATYKDPKIDLHSRIKAASAALPYEEPRLVSKEMKITGMALEDMSDDDIRDALARIEALRVALLGIDRAQADERSDAQAQSEQALPTVPGHGTA